MGIKKLTVPAYKDQFSVAVTVFTPTGYSYDSAATVVILNCATGVPQTYYAPFAKWLSRKGISVITWDYRYIGNSFPVENAASLTTADKLKIVKSPEAAKATISEHWAQRDQPAVIEYALNRFKGCQLIMVGHSVGGHIIPLLPNNLRSKIYRTVLVAVNNPNWQLAPSHFTEQMRSMWANAVELTKEKGYFPPEASLFKIMLPFGVGTEWSSKIGGDDIRYLAGDPALSPFYSSWNPDKEVISMAFQDDITLFSTPKPIDEWCKLLPRTKMTRIIITPEEYGWDTVGHIGMFKEGQEGVWELLREIIVEGRLPAKGEIRRWNQEQAKL